VGQALFAPLARMLDAPGQPKIQLSDEDVAQHDFPALTARYDLVLAHRMDHSPRWPEERVAVIPLAHEPLDVALPAGHRLAGQGTVTAADVVGEPWVTSHTGYSPADVLSAVAAVSSKELNIVHRINDYSTVAALVAAGGVVGLLPRHTARPVLNPGIVLRPLEGISTRRRIDILARPENLKRRSVVIVCEALQAIMTGLVEQGG
jgi:DNA-binding transcriptional LysR family regulator